MKKRIFCLAFCLAISLTANPALAVNCGNVESVPASEIDYSVAAEEIPIEEPTVDWDTAAAIGYSSYAVVATGDGDAEEPIVISVVDLGQAKQGNLTFTVDGQVMVPLRLVAENMGYTVEWNEEAQSATVMNDEINFTVRIGETCPAVTPIDVEADTSCDTYDVSVGSDFVYDIADADAEIADELKADDENCGDYADGVSYDAYDVVSIASETGDAVEIQSADGKTYEMKYTAENADTDVDGKSNCIYTITTTGNAKAQLVNGMTYVPASMFSVMNYNYDAAGNCFTFGKVNVK